MANLQFQIMALTGIYIIHQKLQPNSHQLNIHQHWVYMLHAITLEMVVQHLQMVLLGRKEVFQHLPISFGFLELKHLLEVMDLVLFHMIIIQQMVHFGLLWEDQYKMVVIIMQKCVIRQI